MVFLQRTEAIAQRRFVPILVTVSLALTWIFAVRSGQDANWDQLNYHLAVPFLLLHGGFWESVVPTGIQSFFNPLILIPQFLVITHLPPIPATLLLATPQAMAFVVAGLICREIAGRDSALLGLGGFLLCLLSPIALSEAGTTFVDLVTSVPALLALLLLLTRGRGSTRCAAAGMLLGLAFGLKLTNAIYLFAIPGFFVGGSETPRTRLWRLALTAAGTAAGFLTIAGWWHLQLWRRFANPVFPFANTLFRSPDFPARALRDDRFLPRSPWDIVHFPIYWMFGGSPTPGLLSPSAEIDPHDARFLFVIIGIAGLALACAWPLMRRRCLSTPGTGLILGWAAIYLVWLFGFSIHRYMVGLEILTGAALLALVMQIEGTRRRATVLACLCLISLIVLHTPRWQRVPFADHWRMIEPVPIALPGRPLVILADIPTGFAIASFTADARFVAMTSDFNLSANQPGVLVQQIRELLAEGRTPYLLSLQNSRTDLTATLATWRLLKTKPCSTLEIGVHAFELCTLQPGP
jgi:hypothetical protein